MLFSELKIKNYNIKNRIVMAPMCMYQADNEGFVNEFHLTHYGARAIAGVGTVIVEATAVEPHGRITENDLQVSSDDHIPGLRKLADNIKRFGSIAGIQIAHAGRKSNTPGEIIAPSAINFPKMKVPHEMTTVDINEVKQAFKDGAKRLDLAGFDLIEIHAAHGYLINQFLSPLSNQRTDNYGGSRDNRLRFLSEIIDKIKEVWPKDKLLGIRFSANEYHEDGNNIEDIVYFINELKDKGIDLINVSTGGVVPANIDVYPGYQLDYAKEIKKQTNIPVIGGGLITTGVEADNAIKNLDIDFIYFGRELLRNPHFPRTAAIEIEVEFTVHPSYIRAK